MIARENNLAWEITVTFILIMAIVLVWWRFYLKPENKGLPPEAGGNIVKITAAGFAPKKLVVKVGTAVTWLNEDTKDHWIISDPHPIHNELPDFDSKVGIAPGSSFSFTFQQAGILGYHTEPDQSLTGTVEIIE